MLRSRKCCVALMALSTQEVSRIGTRDLGLDAQARFSSHDQLNDGMSLAKAGLGATVSRYLTESPRDVGARRGVARNDQKRKSVISCCSWSVRVCSQKKLPFSNITFHLECVSRQSWRSRYGYHFNRQCTNNRSIYSLRRTPTRIHPCDQTSSINAKTPFPFSPPPMMIGAAGRFCFSVELLVLVLWAQSTIMPPELRAFNDTCTSWHSLMQTAIPLQHGKC